MVEAPGPPGLQLPPVSDAPSKQHVALRSYLEYLRDKDTRCVVVARRIGQLGFQSRGILRRHYAQYGEVSEVFVAHSRAAKFKASDGESRLRPGNLALILLKNLQSAEWIFSLGELQSVTGFEIQVQRFEQKSLGMNFSEGHTEIPAMMETVPSPTRPAQSATEPMYLHAPPGWAHDEASTFPYAPVQLSPQLQEATKTMAARLVEQVARPAPAQLQAVPQEPCRDYDAHQEQPLLAFDAIRNFLAEPQSTSLPPSIAMQVISEVRHMRSTLQRLEAECQTKLSDLRSEILTSASSMSESPTVNPASSPNMVSSLDAGPQARLAPSCADDSSDDRQQSMLHDPSGKNQERPPAAPDTLRMHLMAVKGEDPSRIFVCRRIGPLGFRSREILKQHYSTYGVVKSIYVAHTKVKVHCGEKVARRIRPGGLGIVVMVTTEAVGRIFEGGEQQEVAGHKILLQPFERPVGAGLPTGRPVQEYDQDVDFDMSSGGSTSASGGSGGLGYSSNGGSDHSNGRLAAGARSAMMHL